MSTLIYIHIGSHSLLKKTMMSYSLMTLDFLKNILLPFLSLCELSEGVIKYCVGQKVHYFFYIK